jgi:hypothetical protein
MQAAPAEIGRIDAVPPNRQTADMDRAAPVGYLLCFQYVLRSL